MGCPVGSERWKEEALRVRKGEREGTGVGHRATGQGTVSIRIRRWGALDYKVVFVWGGGSSAAKQPDWLPSIV